MSYKPTALCKERELRKKAEQERDEAREELSLKCQSVTIASGTISDLFKKSERLEKQIEGLNNFANERFDEIQRVRRERDEARDMVENLTDHGLNLMDSNRMLKCERDEAREALREIQAADWKTAGELRGMARKVLEAAK